MGERDVARRTQVVELGPQQPVGARLLRPEQLDGELPGDRQAAVEEPLFRSRELATRAQLVEEEGADREQQPVAPRQRVRDEQRRVDEVMQRQRSGRPSGPRRPRGPPRPGTARSLAAGPAPDRAAHGTTSRSWRAACSGGLRCPGRGRGRAARGPRAAASRRPVARPARCRGAGRRGGAAPRPGPRRRLPVTSYPGCRRRACSRNARTPGWRRSAARSAVSRGTGRGWRRTTYSPGTWSVTRDVASTRTPGAWRRTVATSSRQASTTCSQLSRTRNRSRSTSPAATSAGPTRAGRTQAERGGDRGEDAIGAVHRGQVDDHGLASTGRRVGGDVQGEAGLADATRPGDRHYRR